MTSEMNIALLPDRGTVAVQGPDALPLLQGLLTNDTSLLASVSAMHAGLLSPQGKILFEFFVVRKDDGVLIDVARDRAADLVKRLSLYKLRANVRIHDVSEDFAVLAAFGPGARLDGPLAYPDPRLADLGWRALVPAREVPAGTMGAELYHAHRVALGVPEGGSDYAFADAFPHEALFDQLHGVSFTKGCYVGQEIVSRMEHRGTARKRIVPVVADGGAITPGAPIAIGDVEIGTLGSVAGSRGLALLRLDRAEDAAGKGVPLTAGGVPVRIALPPWAQFKPIAPTG
jgi:folate-binding protein YgfZ